MKIIRLTGSEPLSDIDFHPDSALLLPGRPLFYPDFGGDWHARLFLAIRINRLGKSVSEKFAPRYYDSFSLALHFIPVDPSAMLPGVLSGLDSSITHGVWLPVTQLAGNITVTTDCQPPCSPDFTLPSEIEVNRAIARVSTYTTLRMGDILLMPLPLSPLPLSPRTHVALSAADTEIISLKIV